MSELNTISVTKKFKFCYSHCLPNYDGPCANVHGHNATLEIEVAQGASPVYRGMVFDFRDFKEIVKPLIDELDHSHINDLTAWKRFSKAYETPVESGFDFKAPTAENMLFFIYCWLLRTNLAFVESIVRLRLYETDDSYAEYRRTV